MSRSFIREFKRRLQSGFSHAISSNRFATVLRLRLGFGPTSVCLTRNDITIPLTICFVNSQRCYIEKRKGRSGTIRWKPARSLLIKKTFEFLAFLRPGMSEVGRFGLGRQGVTTLRDLCHVSDSRRAFLASSYARCRGGFRAWCGDSARPPS